MSKRDQSPKAPRPNAIVIAPGGYEFTKVKVGNLRQLQTLVGGHITILPRSDERFCVYANEEGLMLNLPSNFTAGGMLTYLGQRTETLPLKYILLGTAVLLRDDERPFSKSDKECIRKAYTLWKQSEECAAHDCFDDVSMESQTCSKKECSYLICASCVEQGNLACHKHR